MRIAITNHTGSRNRGCDALIQGVLVGLESQQATRNADIELHTADLNFDRWRFGDRMRYFRAYGLKFPKVHLPFLTLNRIAYATAIRAERLLLGAASPLRDLSGARDADVIISTGGDNFSADYGSFHSHAAYLNLGAPVFLCAQSIGPFSRRDGEYFRKSTGNVYLLTARESRTYSYLKELKLSCLLEQTADVAYLVPVMSREESLLYARKFMNAVLEERKWIGLSISELITKYYKYGRGEGIKQVAKFIDLMNDRGYGVILIPHVCERYLHYDDQITCVEVLRHVRSADANVAMNGWFSSIEVKSVISLCDILIGARTHATIASLSQGIPTVAIGYSRKAWGIMEDFYGPDLGKTLTIPADQVYAETLQDAMQAALQAGHQRETAARMKALALKNFELLAGNLPFGTGR
jgi:colanic acid/amylovoran biosynthesis protein